ncbi:progranulin-like isoform X1 [Labeo rohita]|uniref:progranulin-like isoform X1 n=1 Tax=Labeo rohita TaxID=84645 RepID=UPI0021E34883|nr:progranulin-like isoform X1 [Labeo rohita]XP_050993328.1 progranulin-like isoform X1 [Labeo rohita]XP_050993329.1 progranulin-like isoform X1 [Labeo rohita]
MVPVLMLLMAALVAADEPMMDLSSPAESDSAVSVVHCDSATVCPDGTTCCLTPYGTWSCCPYSLGRCCRDGFHCCPYGYHCDSTSTHCLRGWLKLPSSSRMAATATQKPQVLKWQGQTEKVHCDGNVYCPADQFCCKTAAGQWGCCNDMVL